MTDLNMRPERPGEGAGSFSTSTGAGTKDNQEGPI